MPKATSGKSWPKTTPDVWTPKMFLKQFEVFNCYKRILLVCGSRCSGKTIACLHRIARHLWETKSARVGFFAKSIKSAKDSGPWQDMMEKTLPEWCEADIGFEITTTDIYGNPGAKQDGTTRTSYVKIRNMWGGESEMRLFSIEHDHQVATKVKSKSFSMMFFSELSMFKDPRILYQSLPSLRMPHLKPEQHMWMGDTNPDEDLGNRSWFYKIWYEDRLAKDHTDKVFQAGLHLIELFVLDNPYATLEQISDLRASQMGDPALYEANFLGIHGNAGREKRRLFATLFDKNKHVVGGKEGEGDQIDLRENTTLLFGGWDLGTSTNHGAGILEKWYKLVNGVPKVCWSVLDELVLLHEPLSLHEFTENFMEKQRELQRRYPNRKFEWQHWSDDSSTNVFRASSGSYDYMEIYQASKGTIELRGVQKPKNSVYSRIRLLRILLMEERLYVSSRCTRVIAMLERATKGDDEEVPFFPDEHKHTFDWLTYPMYMEQLDEMAEETNTRPEASAPTDYFGVA